MPRPNYRQEEEELSEKDLEEPTCHDAIQLILEEAAHSRAYTHQVLTGGTLVQPFSEHPEGKLCKNTVPLSGRCDLSHPGHVTKTPTPVTYRNKPTSKVSNGRKEGSRKAS